MKIKTIKTPIKVLGSSRLAQKTVIFNRNINSKNINKEKQKPPFMQPPNQKVNDYATLAWLKYHGRLNLHRAGKTPKTEIRF